MPHTPGQVKDSELKDRFGEVRIQFCTSEVSRKILFTTLHNAFYGESQKPRLLHAVPAAPCCSLSSPCLLHAVHSAPCCSVYSPCSFMLLHSAPCYSILLHAAPCLLHCATGLLHTAPCCSMLRHVFSMLPLVFSILLHSVPYAPCCSMFSQCSFMLFHAAPCLLHAASCCPMVFHASPCCCMSSPWCSMLLHAAPCLLHAASCLLHAAPCPTPTFSHINRTCCRHRGDSSLGRCQGKSHCRRGTGAEPCLMEVYEQNREGKRIPRRGNSMTQGTEARACVASMEIAGSTWALWVGAPHLASMKSVYSALQISR